VPVPVVDEKVKEPRGEERARVDPVVRVLRERLQQVEAVADLGRAREAGPAVWAVVGKFLQQAEAAGELLPEFAEGGVVRHHGELRRGVEDAQRVEHDRHGQRAARIGVTQLVVHEIGDERVPHALRQDDARILPHRPEHPLPPVRALEAEGLGLEAAAQLGGLEAAVEVLEVEHRGPDRLLPDPAVLPAEQEAMQPAGYEAAVGPGDHRVGSDQRAE